MWPGAHVDFHATVIAANAVRVSVKVVTITRFLRSLLGPGYFTVHLFARVNSAKSAEP